MELELMMIIWDAERAGYQNGDWGKRMDEGREEMLPNTILSLLSRLEERKLNEKEGEEEAKSIITVPCGKGTLFKETGRHIFKAYVRTPAISNFATALYIGEELSDEDIACSSGFIDVKQEAYTPSGGKRDDRIPAWYFENNLVADLLIG